MRRYSIVYVQEKGEGVDVTHVQAYGRSEYEAIGYVLKHRIIHSGKVLFVNAFNCDKLPENNNLSMVLKEDRTGEPVTNTEQPESEEG
jgi:hypothetical protein